MVNDIFLKSRLNDGSNSMIKTYSLKKNKCNYKSNLQIQSPPNKTSPAIYDYVIF